MVHAVCGSGKTEITLNVIKYAISHNQRVGFAIPRRDVVKELFYRFKSFFPNNRVVYLHGGHTKLLEGDLICLTTHQLFRYHDYFDLLIIDEIDAFPYAGNEVLEAFMKRSLRGHLIMLSATPSKEVVEKFNQKGKMVLKLNTRFHMHPLPVPEIKICHGIMKYYEINRVLHRFLQENKPVFVFVPTIEMCEQLYNILRFLVKDISYVHSKCPDRTEKIEAFRNGKYKVLVTTAVLERGVTVKNLQVIVFNSNHPLYTSQALIQISGRVGRKKEAPDGEVIFIANSKTQDMEDAISEIRKANSSL